MKSNIFTTQRFDPSSEVSKDEGSGFTCPMVRTSCPYSSSGSVEGYQWVANIGGAGNQVRGSGGALSPGTLEAAPPQQEAITRTSRPQASFQGTVRDMAERPPKAGNARIMTEPVKRYLEEKEDGNVLLRACVSNAEPSFISLFGELDRLGLAPPTPPPASPPVEQDYMVATRHSQDTPQHRGAEQSVEEILYLPSCG